MSDPAKPTGDGPMMDEPDGGLWCDRCGRRVPGTEQGHAHGAVTVKHRTRGGKGAVRQALERGKKR